MPTILVSTVKSRAKATLPRACAVSATPEVRVVGMQQNRARPNWKAGSIGSWNAITAPRKGVAKRIETHPQDVAFHAARAAWTSSVFSISPERKKIILTATYCVGSSGHVEARTGKEETHHGPQPTDQRVGIVAVGNLALLANKKGRTTSGLTDRSCVPSGRDLLALC